mgnify:CR=1 FL=1
MGCVEANFSWRTPQHHNQAARTHSTAIGEVQRPLSVQIDTNTVASYINLYIASETRESHSALPRVPFPVKFFAGAHPSSLTDLPVLARPVALACAGRYNEKEYEDANPPGHVDVWWRVRAA